MSIGNIGGVLHRVQGFIASEFNSPRNPQGLAILPELVERIASLAHLAEANLRVSAPRFFDGTNDVDVASGACKLLAVVVDNTEAAANQVAIYGTATVTEGTTDIELLLPVASSSMALAVLPEPKPLAALSWSSMDGGNTALEAGTLSAANSTKVMLVYAE